MFKLAVFTDEISQDLDVAIGVAKEYKCDAVEVRSVWDTGVHKMTDAQVEEIKRKTGEAGLAICCLGTPFYKCELDKPEEITDHHEILRRCCGVAHKLGTNLVRGFAFWRHGSHVPVWNQIKENFDKPLEILKAEGITMVLENEASTYLGTGAVTAQFLEEINSPNLKAVWDPCNVLFDFDEEETPFPNGYNALKKHMVHFHLKDAERIGPGEARCVRIGEGQIDYRGQLKALIEDGYTGYVSLETHWRPVDISKELMDRPGGSNYSANAETATRLCLESTHEILSEIA